VLGNCVDSPSIPPLAPSNIRNLEQSGADIINSIIQRMIKKGLNSSTITPSLIWGNAKRTSAADLKHWEALLNDPLTVPPAIVQYLLGLRDFNFHIDPTSTTQSHILRQNISTDC
jgi:hypothetical protein